MSVPPTMRKLRWVKISVKVFALVVQWKKGHANLINNIYFTLFILVLKRANMKWYFKHIQKQSNYKIIQKIINEIIYQKLVIN